MSKLSINIIDGILHDYFDKAQFHEYKNLILKINSFLFEDGSNRDFSNKEQLDFDLLSSSEFIEYIDLVITFASEKLKIDELLEFLLLLGETSIAQGELSAAINIYNYILNRIAGQKELENIAGHCYLALGEISSREADWIEAVKKIKKAQNLFNRHKDIRGIVKCNNLLGTIYGDRGNLIKAKLYFENGISLLDPKIDTALIGMMEVNLGIVNNMQGSFDEALSYYERALIKYEQLQDIKRITEIQHNLGMLHTQKGEYVKALGKFDACISTALKSGYVPTLALSYLSKAYIYTELHDYDLADAFSQKSMDLSYTLNDRLSIADLYKIKGIIERYKKNYKVSENYFMTSIRINKELENVMNEAEAYYELGLLYNDMNLRRPASDSFKSSVKNYKKLKADVMVKKVENQLKKLS